MHLMQQLPHQLCKQKPIKESNHFVTRNGVLDIYFDRLHDLKLKFGIEDIDFVVDLPTMSSIQLCFFL